MLFQLRQGIGFFVWVAKQVEETFFELVEDISLMFSGKAVLPFPSRQGGAFDIREDKRNATCVAGGWISKLDISFTFLDKFFTPRATTSELRWFVGFQAFG